MSVLAAVSALLLVAATYMLAHTHRRGGGCIIHGEGSWEVTLYQKLDITMDDVLRGLTSANMISTGTSGVVYKVDTPNGYTLAVKKMWSSDEAMSAAFRSEIAALGSIRHRNIVRLLKWAANGGTRLLFYGYLPNGSLSSLLHGGHAAKGSPADEWGARYEITLGVAHAVAYLHKMRQVLSVAALCVSRRADDRPAMKDVVALLKEIRRPAAVDEAKQPSPTCAAGTPAVAAPVSLVSAHSTGAAG